jgi:predicted GTPase
MRAILCLYEADLIQEPMHALLCWLRAQVDCVSEAFARTTVATIEKQISTVGAAVRAVPVVPISALQTRNLDALWRELLLAHRRVATRIRTSSINAWLSETKKMHPPPARGLARPKLNYATQVYTHPPTVIIFATRTRLLQDAYKKYLANSFRDHFNLTGVPIAFEWREKVRPLFAQSPCALHHRHLSGATDCAASHETLRIGIVLVHAFARA